jgi:tetratricopeptide (TPR) repeat protein
LGHFVKSYGAIIEERNLLDGIAYYRDGTYSLADAMEFIDYAMARMPGFLAGMFIKTDLMLEHGFIPSACTAYEDAIAAARSLMPTDLRVLIAPGGANDLYLLGMENLARAYLRRGDSAPAMQTIKELHRLAFVDHDCRAQCLPAVIAAASDHNENAQLQLAIGGEAASRPLTSLLLRALIYSGAGRHDDAAESLADAVVRQPNLAYALTAGIAEDDRHFRNSDLQLLLERRPEIRERMERALSHPDIKGTLDDVWAKTGHTGCFKHEVLLWPEDEPIPTRVIDMRDGILMLSRLLRNAMR